ncbi:H-NS histone family protein [Arsukibacterium ikkense]|uniref:H-NS histone family protein n=1 Tax=Arsukibacterium ikkense TaxID=336831 RepID=A0A0M2V6Z1_9GAMM|nr:hypothetical protein [Arsukibacterium ikkense]KKO45445.1 H-NS histone family protein [Arsukibacterium ikkense]
MSILLDKRELKKAAKELTLAKLTEVIDTLNSIVAERQNEVAVIGQLEQLAKSQGYTLEQLGYKLSNDVVAELQQGTVQSDKRPTKPKFKSIKKDNQYFYVENGELHLLRTHTMKKGLQERGVDVVPVSEVDKKHAKNIDMLIADATAQARENYNSKVDAWNEWAAANGEEILNKK